MHAATAGTAIYHEANRLGFDYRREAGHLPWRGPIYDVHVHLSTLEAARCFFEVADTFGVEKVWSMTPFDQVDELSRAFGDRLRFIAVPDYTRRDEPNTFTSDWLRRIEQFAAKGVKVCKFWAAPRGRDFGGEALTLDSPQRFEQMRLARSLGMMFMVHVADPDTWFATHYRDAARYGTKDEHYTALRRALDAFGDVPWLAAHMAGTPEDLERLQGLLDDYPQLHVDTSATKWMVRELSRHADSGALAQFIRRNPGRVLFGSDIVASDANVRAGKMTDDGDEREGDGPGDGDGGGGGGGGGGDDGGGGDGGGGGPWGFDLYASRYWALRTLLETAYHGPSPIVDPDLALLDPSLPTQAAPTLRGAKLDEASLAMVYHQAAAKLLERWAEQGAYHR